MEILLGCGSNLNKKVVYNNNFLWNNLITVDINEDHNPRIVYDLEKIPLPFADESAEEIHAYEVLEHLGNQGDYKFFFKQFNDFYRILKPNGVIIGTCPLYNQCWAFGDPSHKRVIQKESFHFLNQTNYTREVGKTSMSDFRYIYDGDFELVHYKEYQVTFEFILQAIKPSRKTVHGKT
jgi:hypothetical protein